VTVRLLVANRGEIARRIQRTAHRLGHETVAAWADPDRDAPFVREATIATRLGPAALERSYLSVDAVLGAAARTGADAVHPGYGFLAERADLARAVLDAGLVWVGPHPGAIEQMGSKVEARRLAAAAGVPTIPGFDTSQDRAELAAAAGRIGYPVLVKASAGGGGKGIRVVHHPEQLPRALEEAAAEAERAFGDGTLIVERFVLRPRHVEVQVLGDRHGTVVHLGTRECSLQRRYQKVVEEAPAPNLDPATEAGVLASALELARAIGYDSAGTVEFIVDDDTGEHLFLEMNTRLQVEHPVTEAVTGLDLVELQLAVAQGRPVPVDQDAVRITGHAFEARINAEDPARGFLPGTGTVEALRVPPGVRWDSGIEEGSAVTPHYDPLLAQVVVAGRDRDQARRALIGALDGLVVAGVATNAGFVRRLLHHPEVVAGRATTRLVDGLDHPAPDVAALAGRAARLWRAERARSRAGGGPWSRLGPFRLTPHRPPSAVTVVHDGAAHDIDLGDPASWWAPPGGAHVVDLRRRLVALNHEGETVTFRVPSRQQRWAAPAAPPMGGEGSLTAPFPALVAEVRVGAGDQVRAGEVLVVLEAMKMLHPVIAPGAGVVATVAVSAGDQVGSGQVLVTLAAHGAPAHGAPAPGAPAPGAPAPGGQP
jgi:acetyl/propionyl-CoA carboxylase alpha subunit